MNIRSRGLKKSLNNSLLTSAIFSIALATTLSILPVNSQQIIPDGRTNTILNINGNNTNVSTTTIRGANAFNSFSRFNVDAGNIVNLVVPAQSMNLINLVHNEISNINGTLNAFKNGQIGGNVFLLNPHGVVIGSQGVINVGSLTALTPTIEYMNSFFNAPGDPNNAAIATLLAGNTPINPEGSINNSGLINAVTDVKIDTGTFANEGEMNAGAAFQVNKDPLKDQIQPDDIINVNTVDNPCKFAVNNGKLIVNALKDITNSGRMNAPGGDNVDAGRIVLTAERNITLEKDSEINAAGRGENSSGGNVYIFADNDTYFKEGTLINASASSFSGDGGSVEVSAKNTVQLGGLVKANGYNGKPGNILFDPATLQINTNQLSDGANLTFEADTKITVWDNIIISTRNLTNVLIEDHATALSQGNSGNVTFKAPEIELGYNNKVYTFANNGYNSGNVSYIVDALDLTQKNNFPLKMDFNAGDGTLYLSRNTSGKMFISNRTIDAALLAAIQADGYSVYQLIENQKIGSLVGGNDSTTSSVTTDAALYADLNLNNVTMDANNDLELLEADLNLNGTLSLTAGNEALIYVLSENKTNEITANTVNVKANNILGIFQANINSTNTTLNGKNELYVTSSTLTPSNTLSFISSGNTTLENSTLQTPAIDINTKNFKGDALTVNNANTTLNLYASGDSIFQDSTITTDSATFRADGNLESINTDLTINADLTSSAGNHLIFEDNVIRSANSYFTAGRIFEFNSSELQTGTFVSSSGNDTNFNSSIITGDGVSISAGNDINGNSSTINGTNTTVTAGNSILGYNFNLNATRDVTLSATRGTIGYDYQYIKINEGDAGVIRATAAGDIFLKETVGNMNVYKIKSTGNGNIYLAVVSGSVLNANPTGDYNIEGHDLLIKYITDLSKYYFLGIDDDPHNNNIIYSVMDLFVEVFKSKGQNWAEMPDSNFRIIDADRQVVTKAEIIAALTEFAGKLEANDVLFIAYEGHGGPGPDMFPVDENNGIALTLDDEYMTFNEGFSIRDDEFAAALQNTKGNIVFVSSQCYGGGMFGGSADLDQVGQANGLKYFGISNNIETRNGWGLSYSKVGGDSTGMNLQALIDTLTDTNPKIINYNSNATGYQDAFYTSLGNPYDQNGNVYLNDWYNAINKGDPYYIYHSQATISENPYPYWFSNFTNMTSGNFQAIPIIIKNIGNLSGIEQEAFNVGAYGNPLRVNMTGDVTIYAQDLINIAGHWKAYHLYSGTNNAYINGFPLAAKTLVDNDIARALSYGLNRLTDEELINLIISERENQNLFFLGSSDYLGPVDSALYLDFAYENATKTVLNNAIIAYEQTYKRTKDQKQSLEAAKTVMLEANFTPEVVSELLKRDSFNNNRKYSILMQYFIGTLTISATP